MTSVHQIPSSSLVCEIVQSIPSEQQGWEMSLVVSGVPQLSLGQLCQRGEQVPKCPTWIISNQLYSSLQFSTFSGLPHGHAPPHPILCQRWGRIQAQPSRAVLVLVPVL